jgi:capsular polysaccharide biosynthesis protein
MPDLFDLVARWWKRILALVLITTALTAVIVLLIPRKYLGVATALPASTYAQDKTGVFSQNMQSLYSALGTPDDLDMIVGTAHLDTVYRAVTGELNVTEHYDMKKGDLQSLVKTAHLLKERTKVIKSDYGELKVKVWDGDPRWAASLANAIMRKLQQVHQDVQTTNNATMLAKINADYNQKKADYQILADSQQHATNPGKADLLNMQKSSLLQQMGEYEKLLDQYKLMVNARPQTLIVVENASPALKPDKPRPLLIIIGAAVLSLFFGLLAALLSERRISKSD